MERMPKQPRPTNDEALTKRMAPQALLEQVTVTDLAVLCEKHTIPLSRMEDTVARRRGQRGSPHGCGEPVPEVARLIGSGAPRPGSTTTKAAPAPRAIRHQPGVVRPGRPSGEGVADVTDIQTPFCADAVNGRRHADGGGMLIAGIGDPKPVAQGDYRLDLQQMAAYSMGAQDDSGDSESFRM